MEILKLKALKIITNYSLQLLQATVKKISWTLFIHTYLIRKKESTENVP